MKLNHAHHTGNVANTNRTPLAGTSVAEIIDRARPLPRRHGPASYVSEGFAQFLHDLVVVIAG